ncbi:hypothetical protein FGB62_291g08 [Gracilaria domingensis]|nr:hypothetical protein FGB62_291g08 [Gracilaria domingensis]
MKVNQPNTMELVIVIRVAKGDDTGVSPAEDWENSTRTSITSSGETMSSDMSDWNMVRRCKCEHKLSKRAEKRSKPGTNKYYWEGWKPKSIFEEYPLLYELEGTEAAEEQALHGKGNEEENIVELTDGEGSDDDGEPMSNGAATEEEESVEATDPTNMV